MRVVRQASFALTDAVLKPRAKIMNLEPPKNHWPDVDGSKGNNLVMTTKSVVIGFHPKEPERSLSLEVVRRAFSFKDVSLIQDQYKSDSLAIARFAPPEISDIAALCKVPTLCTALFTQFQSGGLCHSRL